jgi:YD repeat-containing protein
MESKATAQATGWSKGTLTNNQIALVDQNGNRNSFSYNAADNKTLELDPLSRRTTLGYDIAGGADSVRRLRSGGTSQTNGMGVANSGSAAQWISRATRPRKPCANYPPVSITSCASPR